MGNNREDKFPTIDEVFRPGGILARTTDRYEVRPEQREMALAVEAAFQRGGHLCVEAGTGTGKTLAYLVPALGSGNRVIVSTGTKALQEQLIHKDLPFLSKALRRRISVCVVKGRNNYLCLERMDAARQSPRYGGLFPEETLLRIGKWAGETSTGDRAELSGLVEDLPEWKFLDARREICLGQDCRFYKECFVTRVRQKASESQIVIVNHHLFFADLALKDGESGGVLPDYASVIFDEAHEIDTIATRFFGVSVNNYRFEEWKRDVDRALVERDEDHVRFRKIADDVIQAAALFFKSWGGNGDGGRRRLFSGESPSPEELSTGKETTELRLRLSRAVSHLARMQRTELLDDLHRRLQEISREVQFVLDGDNPDFVYWREVRGRGVFLQASPINVSEILREKLFARVRTAVLTSATLATNGNFGFIRSRLGLDSTTELVLGSHFHFDHQAILYIPSRICSPRHEKFAEAMAEQVQDLLAITEGRAFVLFTSYHQMHRVYDILELILPYPLLIQGQSTVNQLLDEFRSTPHCVLFGTTSFWQGVDVQGKALSCVILEKLPFSVPSEPLVEARLEQIRDRGEDAFYSYQVPEAIILLKQGLGRLIRSRNDRGVLAILDRRILTHPYGKQFRENLPVGRYTDDLGRVRQFFHTSGQEPADP